MTQRLAFVVLGEPRGWARARLGKNGHHFTDKRTRAYEYEVSDQAAYHAVAQKWPRAFADPCAVVIDAVFQRPADRMRKKDPDGRMPRERGRIDADNVAKAVLDGLQKSGVFRNDAQVCDLHVRLWWTAVGEAPCVEVEVLTLMPTASVNGRSLQSRSEDVEAVGHAYPARAKGAFR